MQLLFADRNGKVYPYPGLVGCGMKAGQYCKLDVSRLIKLPNASEIFMLPDRSPVGFDPKTNQYTTLHFDPYSEKEEPVFAVAAFISPGHTLTHSSAYEEKPGTEALPLFAYGACVLHQGDFYVAALKIDSDIRHEERFFDARKVEEGTRNFKRLFPRNRLIGHLTTCATLNACANAKNFFLGRFEAPIPTSPVCNAQCQGCISFQPAGRMPSTQSRIAFTPTAEEIAELALYHIAHEEKPLVSFGQGCEGEPTLQSDTIERAIRLIRSAGPKGMINVNTNASRPEALARLFDAGLNSVRVSTNSVREPYYSLYYQPKGYALKDVIESVRVAKKKGGFVSLNYLSMPGFTDSEPEFEALRRFVSEESPDMIQWRNLNYDPLQYFRDLKIDGSKLKGLGMAEIIERLKKEFPALRMGYFNPRDVVTARRP